MKVAVIGGGAAGFFAALQVKENHPQAAVTIFEQSNKLLAKVKISGGGRCNVTNACTSIAELSKAYPRGGKQLKKAFRQFHTQHIMQWFEERQVALYTQEDNCVFPVSQSSQSVIDCFLKEAKQAQIAIHTRQGVRSIQPVDTGLELHFAKPIHAPLIFDKVIVATGGSPKLRGLEWLAQLNHKIEPPVPSLFTFNMPDEEITELMGVVVEPVIASIAGTKLKATGPLLITHWGMSGPAILKLSAFGARVLQEKNYQFQAQVNWVNTINHDEVKQTLKTIVHQNGNKSLPNVRPYQLPKRLWHFLLQKVGLPEHKKWNELGKKGLNKLTTILTNDQYEVSGKTTFKEEFVTCGGVSLESVNFNTMQSKVVDDLYFAGEVLDIDGITGGYNFQAAWTTAFIAGQLIDKIE